MRKKDLDFFKLSHFHPKSTGLPVIIWVSVQLEDMPPVVMIMEENCEVSISIDDDPKIVEGECNLGKDEMDLIYRWIKINKKILLQHWFQKIATDEYIKRMKKVG